MNDISTGSDGTILLVDDAPANLRLLATVLREQGYTVRTVMSGLTALHSVHLDPPELIMLDISLPDIDGYAVCRELKMQPTTSDIPVIFLSSYNEPRSKVQAFEAGAVDYITKPFHLPEILARVHIHLNFTRLQRDLESQVQQRIAELSQLNKAYARFLPHDFLQMLGCTSVADMQLGDCIESEQDMTIMFVNIRSFTTLSEQMTAQENLRFLNEYLQRVNPVIRQHQGYIDKVLGDTIKVLFPRSADDGLQAALAVLAAIDTYNTERQTRGQTPIRAGIGLHTGPLMLGIIGEPQHMQGTVISDGVNLTARLERLTRRYDATILVSAHHYQRLHKPPSTGQRLIGRVRVKGKQHSVVVHEVFAADAAEQRCLKQRTREAFEHGLALYYNRQFSTASVQFQQVVALNPRDIAAQLYWERAAHHNTQPVGDDWDGAESLMEI